MLVPDDVRKCVAFVGVRLPSGEFRLGGTAFFAAREVEDKSVFFYYAVTAKHALDSIRGLGLDKVYLRMNFKGEDARWVETSLADWFVHPTDSTVDVAVTHLALGEHVDHLAYPTTSFATYEILAEQGIGVGDEVFVTGLFIHHLGQRRNIPIVRIGNIAAMPEEKVESKIGPIDAYLVEARSIGGLSGSPVFAHLGLVRWYEGGMRYATRPGVYYLLGLMHGHFDTQVVGTDVSALAVDSDLLRERVNMGIAIVVPAHRILEVINQPRIRALEDAVSGG